MSIETRLIATFTQVGTDIAQRISDIGDLTALNTLDQSSLVNAINEVMNLIASSGGGDLLSSDNLSGLTDFAAARTNLDVRSTAEITAEISNAIAGVTLASLNGLTEAEVDARAQLAVDALAAGAPAALDTLVEFADAINNDANFAATITTALSNRVRFDAAQTLTAAQQTQVGQNIGIGEPDFDYLNTYTTARDA